MVIRSIIIAAGLALAAAPTLAGITPYEGGYGPRAASRAVLAGDAASMSLVMIDANDNSIAVNMGGHVNVTRGASFTSLGNNRNGGGQILGSWDEVVQGNDLYINAIFKTSDGSMFMPPTATVNGSPAFFWKWQFGTTEAVNYMPWVESVGLTSARIFFSDNGGQSFSSFSNISGLNGSFMAGRDNGNYLATIGDGTNYILLQYRITPVPAPAGAAALAGAALLATRRRRR
ncbi:MAG TPA: hypothetical protein VD997_06180 [Phycisphaerales bacterium]|nr:hypothetical protein [Phycisphaerales bacterium]